LLVGKWESRGIQLGCDAVAPFGIAVPPAIL